MDSKTLLKNARTIAVVGCSATPGKDAHNIPKLLHEMGWTVYPVNPRADTIFGVKCYASLADVPGPIDIVDVFRPAEEAPGVAHEAVKVGAKALWLQLGIKSDEARSIATDAGLAYVENECIGIVAQKL